MAPEQFAVPVKTWLKPALFRRLHATAETHQVTVGDLVAECVRRQLAGVGPIAAAQPDRQRKRRRIEWTEEMDALIRLRHSEHVSDMRISLELGENQPAVSARRKALGLPSLFRSPNTRGTA